MENDDEDDVLTEWDTLKDGIVAPCEDSINAAFESFCDVRGYSGKDFINGLFRDRDCLQSIMEKHTFPDYDSAFRAWCAYFWQLAHHTCDCKYGWQYHYFDYAGVMDSLTEQEHKKFNELQLPAMIAGFAKEAVQNGNTEELETLYHCFVSRTCNSEEHFDNNFDFCDCKEGEYMRGLFHAQGLKYESLIDFLHSIPK